MALIGINLIVFFGLLVAYLDFLDLLRLLFDLFGLLYCCVVEIGLPGFIVYEWLIVVCVAYL